jgi:fermentation-respiration switch protein FrsA (DUF1100 family)
MLYQPSPYLYVDPAQLKLKPEIVEFASTDGTALYGWYFGAIDKKPAKGLIAFFHGNAQNLTSHYLNLVWLLKEGYDFFIFDYRGYGKSAGQPTPEGTVEDGKAAIRWAGARARERKLPLVVYGQSLGGAVALESLIELRGEVPVRLVVADSTFASYRAAGRSVLAKHALTWLFQPVTYLALSDAKAPGDRVAELAPTPLIVVHGDRDGVIDFSLGEDLFARAREPKELWRVPGGQHIDSMSRQDPEFRRKLLNKLTGLSNKP